MLQSAAFLLLILPLIDATFPLYNLFQGAPYYNSFPQQRNKNWCAFVVQKNVTCAVLDVVETAPCPEHMPHCAHAGIYRARPMYKVGYKQVTEMEWRCCPGYRGHNCMEQREAPSSPHILQKPDQPSNQRTQQSVLGPEVSSGSHPWAQPGQGGQANSWTEGGEAGRQTGQPEGRRVRELEEEVQRLSLTVYDLQAAMTAANANLRQNLQEDASKIVLNVLDNLRQSQHALSEGTESFVLPSDSFQTISPVPDELQEQVTHLSDTISSNTNSIQGLEAKILQLEGQVNRITETAGRTTVPLPSSAPVTECQCQAYVDQKIQALQMELLEGMDIKIADLKNACDYKMKSVKEQCEEQETSYLSLTELLESKEADLRQEIQDLKDLVSAGNPKGLESPDLQAEIQNLKNAHQSLTSAFNQTKIQHKALEEALETRVSLAERSVEVHCNHLEEKLRKQQAKELEAQSKSLETKISAALHVLGGTQQQIIPVNSHYMVEKEPQNLKDEMGPLVQQVKHLENSVQILNESISHQSHTDGLYDRLNKLEEACGKCQESVNRLETMLSGMNGRMTNIEGVCDKLEPMSDSLSRIKDGLNKHVSGLWNCVKQLNKTVLTHTSDINTLRRDTLSSMGKEYGTPIMQQFTGPGASGGMEDVSAHMEKAHPVLETGEAGPPGTMLSSPTPQGSNGSMTPVKGYGVAPGYPPKSAVSVTAHFLPGSSIVSAPVSFSAGLTLFPFFEKASFIPFNKVLVNDGSHYDPNTGVFTVPVDARYLLSVVITAQKGERVEAVLSVANISIQKLDTSGSSSVDSAGCICGGSASASLVLDLKKGQKVGVVKTSGTLASPASHELLSTFSGVLLYSLPTKS
ncbi:EMILIN-2 [Trichomycterus rosablanca]|uniref:EMILIN-2 n=1 Tax=Trichomycterus rosablanca TaxID=2290929 RepID=UPI002F352A6D